MVPAPGPGKSTIRGYILCLVSDWADVERHRQEAAVVMWRKYTPSSCQPALPPLGPPHRPLRDHEPPPKEEEQALRPTARGLEALEAKASRRSRMRDRRREALQRCIAQLSPA